MKPVRSIFAGRWWVGVCLLMLMLIAVAPGCSRNRPGPTPEVVEAMNRGVALMSQYDYLGAAAAFESVLDLAPELAEARINLAIALFNLGRKEDQDLDRAGELLRGLLAERPDDVRALYSLGILLQHIGNAEEAVAVFDRVVQRRPEDGAAWYLLALCKQRIDQPSETEFLKAVELRPYLYSAYYRLFQLAQTRGDKDQAQQYLERFKALRDSPLGESIELPQYNAMGELALARGLAVDRSGAIAPAQYRAGSWQAASGPVEALRRSTVAEWSLVAVPEGEGKTAVMAFPQAGDASRAPLILRLAESGLQSNPLNLPLEGLAVRSVAVGDVDHDGRHDLLVTGESGSRLLLQGESGDWVDRSPPDASFTGPEPRSQGLLWDADHDGDLDLLVAAASGCQLWQNNADGSFTNLTLRSGIQVDTAGAVAILPGDVDQDRDHDWVVLRRGAPATLLLNDLLGGYRSVPLSDEPVRGEGGGVMQDFDGDGVLDLVVLGGEPQVVQLYRGDGRGRFIRHTGMDSVATATRSWGSLQGLRAVDIDLDGDSDLAVLSDQVHLLLNDGCGRFVLQPRVWQWPSGVVPAGVGLVELDGDGIADLLGIGGESEPGAWFARGGLSLPATALTVQVTGTRGRDGRTRSPSSGYGVRLVARAGLQEQDLLYSGLDGGPNQSPAPLVIGLNGASKADYLRLHWTDGVMQAEVDLAAGILHTIAELERKISSCPVLFAWNGRRMEFITDFAGVGGLGYFVAPGVYGQPQPVEHVKIEPDQLRPRDGVYELSVCEPMEESAYIDSLALQAVDHPVGWTVFPDERAVAGGPPPTRELLAVEHPIRPTAARDAEGRDCLERLRDRDRLYAYQPVLDRQFIGFCRDHTLELDFGDELQSVTAEDPLFLFVAGFIEYPYSQTIFAAGQAEVQWQPVRVERLEPDGTWSAVVSEGGWPGGMGRVFTLDLSGHSWNPRTTLRLSTNLEVYYDQVFVGRPVHSHRVTTTTLPLLGAELRRLGFPREYSPDGRLPLLYDYEVLDASAPFHTLSGSYTRYGPVETLLATVDDRQVLMAPGDEVRLRFDARRLEPPGEGMTRSFMLVSHAYCKDMDLYTATPQTLEPLPFRGMSRYPYPEGEGIARSDEDRRSLELLQTRLIP